MSASPSARAAGHATAAPRYEYVHTLHLWDADLPTPKVDYPCTVPQAVSVDDDEYVLRGVHFMGATTQHWTVDPQLVGHWGGPLVATLRVPADAVHVIRMPDGNDPATGLPRVRTRVTVADRDVLVPGRRGAGTIDDRTIRWYDERGARLADAVGALYADVDVFVGAVTTRRGAGPTPPKNLSRPGRHGPADP